MKGLEGTEARVIKREAALQRLDHVTTGVALAAVAGVGVFAAISAATIPGTTSVQAATGAPTQTGPSGGDETSVPQTDPGTASGLQPVTGVGSSSGPGLVVSGGSHSH